MRARHILPCLAVAALTLASCDDFLDGVQPQGVVSEEQAMRRPDEMVYAAYAALGNDWYQYPFNLWPYGDVASDDALKGGGQLNDTDYHTLEVWSTLTSQSLNPADELWYRLYLAISRANRALISLGRYGEAVLGAEATRLRRAEMKFVRAHFYFKLIQVFNRVPWVDETVHANRAFEQTPNNQTHEWLMRRIIADFEEAYNTLPESQEDRSRANKIAAAAYLAKCHLTLAYGDGYEATNGYSRVNADDIRRVVEYTGVVMNSSHGLLDDFGDVFLPEYRNSVESVYAVQHSGYSQDNTVYGRANWGNTLNGVWGIWSCGWDFHKPSQDLVNAFKTRDGLPMFDDYDATDAYPVNEKPTEQKWDPRLFHTVGMPTFPYKYESQYTLTMANSRDPNDYGFYCSMKEVPQRSQGETFSSPWQAFAMNEYVFRYADVMLMRAEALIEQGNFDAARDLINQIRRRAKNSMRHIGYAADQVSIEEYPAENFASKEQARRALRWERRLELAMESHRFFDLRRWGLASTTLNAYFRKAQESSYEGVRYAQYYSTARFEAGKNEYFPLPYNQFYYTIGLYEQNRGY